MAQNRDSVSAEQQRLFSRPASVCLLSLLSFLPNEAFSLSSQVGDYVDTATGLVSAVSGEQLGNYFQKY